MKNITRVLCLTFLCVGAAAQGQTNHFKDRIQKLSQHPTKSNDLSFQAKKAMYPDSIEHYSFDPFKESYESDPGNTSFPSYDVNGNLIENITVFVSNMSSNRKNTYQYDAFGETSESIYYGWSIQDNDWEPKNKSLYYRNDKGADTLEDYYDYNPLTTQWELQSRYGYGLSYGSTNLLESVIFKQYDMQSNDWNSSERIRFIYQGADTEPFEVYLDELDSQGVWQEMIYGSQLAWGLGFNGNINDFEPTIYLIQEWDGMDWLPAEYDSSIVDNGNIIESYSYSYDAISTSFVLDYSRFYQFNSQGEQVYSLDLSWDSGIADTSSIEIDSFIYGSNGERLEHVNARTSFFGGNSMEFKYKEIYYYGNTGLEAKTQLNLQVYPNPVASQGLLYIHSMAAMEQVQLIALDGRIIKEWKTELTTGMSMEGIEHGLYFIRAMDQNGMLYSGRVQVK